MKRVLSKSKLMAYRQCARRLWLEIHRPRLREDSAATQTSFDVGHQVGEIARQLYDPLHEGTLIDPGAAGLAGAFARTGELLNSSRPIFEAGFTAGGALALADVLLPISGRGPRRLRIIEVKSSTAVKDYHHDDAAIQVFVAREAGVRLSAMAIAHIDGGWTYQGGNDYMGLLKEVDVTTEAFGRGGEVKAWIAESQAVVRRRTEPAISTGSHCQKPYACGFIDHCTGHEPLVEYPVAWLPRVQTKALKTYLETSGVSDLRGVPDHLLNAQQLRVKTQTISGTVYFNAKGARAELSGAGWPAYFMDFETIGHAVPIWAGTRPFRQMPFQFSVHRIAANGRLSHEEYVDLTGEDPSALFAEALLSACGTAGPVYVYNANFEKMCLKALAERVSKLAQPLMAIIERVRDLLPVAERHYYHPKQRGSWSIKRLLPAIAPELSYDKLDGVHDGGMAMNAYREATVPITTKERRVEIEEELLSYCELDTLAMVRVWQQFTGRSASR